MEAVCDSVAWYRDGYFERRQGRKCTEVWQNDGMLGWEWGHKAASSHFILLFTFTNGEHEVSFFFPFGNQQEIKTAVKGLKMIWKSDIKKWL